MKSWASSIVLDWGQSLLNLVIIVEISFVLSLKPPKLISSFPNIPRMFSGIVWINFGKKIFFASISCIFSSIDFPLLNISITNLGSLSRSWALDFNISKSESIETFSNGFKSLTFFNAFSIALSQFPNDVCNFLALYATAPVATALTAKLSFCFSKKSFVDFLSSVFTNI